MSNQIPYKKPFDRRFPRKQEDKHKINNKITATEVRLIADDKSSEVINTYVAIQRAKDLGVDLVEVSPNAVPPVCRLIDYKNFLYDSKKKEKENKKNNNSTTLKEIKLSPNIGEHDYKFKAKQADEFLVKGNRVKVTIFFKGREIVHKNNAELVMLKFSQEVLNSGKVEQLPKYEGKYLTMILIPNKK